MEISEKALRRLVRDVDDEHRQTLPALAAGLGEIHHGQGRGVRPTSRRAFLARAGGVGATIAIGSAVLPIAPLVAAAQEEEELKDEDIAAFAESIELAAVEAYQLALAGGKITVPAVVQAATTYAGHHREHAAAFAAVSANTAKGKPNPTVLRALRDQLAAASDQAGVVRVAFDVENAAASTYLFAVSNLKDQRAVQLAASILPVEAQHAISLGQVLGRPLEGLFPPHPNPTETGPNSFETKDQALEPSTHPLTD